MTATEIYNYPQINSSAPMFCSCNISVAFFAKHQREITTFWVYGGCKDTKVNLPFSL